VVNPVSSLPSLSGLYDAALALVYPQACAICGASVESRHDGVACGGCWNATRLFDDDDACCSKCGALSPGHVAASQNQVVRCGHCEDEFFDAARACGTYEGALRASLLELKRRPHVPQRLVELTREALKREPLKGADLILAVPLHAARERERGFNQALALATKIARASGLPLDRHSLVRTVETQMHRGGMDAKARRKSVAGAFRVRRQDLIAGKQVLLVDDVFTTGATVSACAAALKEAGAVKIFVLTVARA